MAAPLTAGLSAVAMAAPAAGVSALSIPGVPRGVDLNLNQFSLDAPEAMVEGSWLCEPQSKDAVAAMAEGFWSCVADGKESSAFEEKDLMLLKSVFNPKLS